jgi:hypothetical protein
MIGSHAHHQNLMIDISINWSLMMDSYEELRRVWFEYVRTRKGAKVSVIDKKKRTKGFG